MRLPISKRRCDPDELAVLTCIPASVTVGDKACIFATLPTCNSLYKLVSITLQEGITSLEAECILIHSSGHCNMPSKLLVKCL